jgi:hypothetical protein
MRKAAMIAAAVALAAIILALVIPRLVSLEAWKPRIVAILEEKTGRRVSFSRISLSLIPRVAVKVSDLSVSGDPGHPGEKLVSVPEAEIRLAILPLLSGRAELGRFLLRRPEVLFRRYRDGTHSATPIADRMAGGEGAAPSPPGKVSVAMKEISIEEAKLTLITEGDDGGEDRWRIDPLTVRLSGMDEPRKEFEVETRVDGAVRGDLEFSGHATREGSAADPAAYRVGGKGTAFGQKFAVDGRVSALTEPSGVDLNVSFPKIEMESVPGIFARPPEALSKASLRGAAALGVKVSGGREAVAAEADLRLGSLSAKARGSLVITTGKREWNASAAIASLADFAKSGAGGLSQWDPAGRVAVTAKGERPSASAKETWNAALELGGAGFRLTDPGMTMQGLNGRVELSERAVDFRQISGSLNGRRFTLSGPVSLDAAPAGTLSLYMAYLDLDELFPPSEAGDQPKKAGPAPAGTKDKKAGVISARGNLRIDAGKARGLEFRELAGTGRYEGGTLFIDSMKARLYGGEAAISGRIGLSGKSPDFRLKMQVKDVAAEEILSRKTALKDFLSGKASLSAEVGGGAGDFADFTRTAAGSGSFKASGGKIRGVDLLASAAGVSGLQALLSPGRSATGGRAAETSFSDLSADFRVEGGKIRTDSLRIVTDKAGLSGSAVVGFDRTLDFRGKVVLSREMSARARGAAGRFLEDPAGRVEIPLVMTGAVTSPSVAIDAEALARGLGGKAIRGLMEKTPGKAEPGKALEGLFEKLLPGKK